jgi:hypothetical protein
MSFRLGQKRIRNPPEQWIRRDNAFTALISTEDFRKAQVIIARRSRKVDNKALLDKLKGLLKTAGRLTSNIINAAQDMPSSTTYSNHFGSLGRAYALVGWQCDHDLTFATDRKHYMAVRRKLLEPILKHLVHCGATYRRLDRYGLFAINGEFTVFITLIRCATRQNSTVWKVILDRTRSPDIWLIVRLAPGEPVILDYIILPGADVKSRFLFMGEQLPVELISYRFDTLEPFLSLCRRRSIEGAL